MKDEFPGAKRMHSTIAEEYRAITPGFCMSVAYWEAEEGFMLNLDDAEDALKSDLGRDIKFRTIA